MVHKTDKDGKEEEGDCLEVGFEEATEFRGIVARLNFIGQDSPDLQYVVKECSRDMSKPTVGAWKG